MKLSALLLLILTVFSLTFLGLSCNALPLLYPFSSDRQPRPGTTTLGIDLEELLSGEDGAVEASSNSILDAALDSLSWPGSPFLRHSGTSPTVHDAARNRQSVFLEVQAPITPSTSVPKSRGRRGDSVKHPSWLTFLVKRDLLQREMEEEMQPEHFSRIQGSVQHSSFPSVLHHPATIGKRNLLPPLVPPGDSLENETLEEINTISNRPNSEQPDEQSLEQEHIDSEKQQELDSCLIFEQEGFSPEGGCAQSMKKNDFGDFFFKRAPGERQGEGDDHEGHFALLDETTETYSVASNHSSGSFRSGSRTAFEQEADRGATRLSDLLTLQEKLLVDLQRVTQELEKHLQESALDEQQSR